LKLNKKNTSIYKLKKINVRKPEQVLHSYLTLPIGLFNPVFSFAEYRSGRYEVARSAVRVGRRAAAILAAGIYTYAKSLSA